LSLANLLLRVGFPQHPTDGQLLGEVLLSNQLHALGARIASLTAYRQAVSMAARMNTRVESARANLRQPHL